MFCQLSGDSGGVVACLRMGTTGSAEFWILAQEYPGLGYATELRIDFRSRAAARRLLNYRSTDHLISMYPLSPADNKLLTIWEGGSHVGFRIFLLTPEKAELIFDRKTEYVPEVLWGAILLNRGKVFRDSYFVPEVTEIYRWEDPPGRYELKGVVPWSERYRKLAEMNHMPGAADLP